MVALLDLWLPILLSAVFVFIASSIIHMALPLHRGDYKKLPDEAQLLESMRAQGVQPGEYMFPCAGSMKDMGTPEMVERYNRGPVGFLSVVPSGVPSMGTSLIEWFIHSVVIGIFVAYIATFGQARGAPFMDIFRLTTTAAILGHAVTHVPHSIWKGLSWGITLKFILDGVIYGLVTGATFAWLWPAAG